VHGLQMTLSGRMGGKPMPRRLLRCMKLHAGLWCEAPFGPVLITVMTNGSRMTETITARATGAEQAGFAYVCSGPP
jgi:hypothetical protein